MKTKIYFLLVAFIFLPLVHVQSTENPFHKLPKDIIRHLMEHYIPASNLIDFIAIDKVCLEQYRPNPQTHPTLHARFEEGRVAKFQDKLNSALRTDDYCEEYTSLVRVFFNHLNEYIQEHVKLNPQIPSSEMARYAQGIINIYFQLIDYKLYLAQKFTHDIQNQNPAFRVLKKIEEKTTYLLNLSEIHKYMPHKDFLPESNYLKAINSRPEVDITARYYAGKLVLLEHLASKYNARIFIEKIIKKLPSKFKQEPNIAFSSKKMYRRYVLLKSGYAELLAKNPTQAAFITDGINIVESLLE